MGKEQPKLPTPVNVLAANWRQAHITSGCLIRDADVLSCCTDLALIPYFNVDGTLHNSGTSGDGNEHKFTLCIGILDSPQSWTLGEYTSMETF